MKVITKVDKRTNRELNLKNKIIWYIIAVICLMMAVSYIVTTVMNITNKGYSIFIIVCMFIIALFCVLMIVLIHLIGKWSEEAEREVQVDYYDNYMNIQTLEHGVKTDDQIRLNYDDVFKMKETKHYLFVYPDKKSAYPVEKALIGEEDLMKLKNSLIQGAINNKIAIHNGEK